MPIKIVKEYGMNGIAITDEGTQPYAMLSLDEIRYCVVSLKDAQSAVSKITNPEASIALELLHDKLRPTLRALEEISKEIGVDIQLDNPEFEYESAKKELEEAMKALRDLNGPNWPSAT